MANVRSLNSKWFRAAPVALQIAVASLGLGATTGCSLLNTKGMFALAEGAPLSVALRRAEIARETALHVERLIGETGVDEDSKWTVKTALKKEDAEALLKEIATEGVYIDGKQKVKIRILAAEAREATLAGLCSSESKFPSLIATLGDDVKGAYAEVAGTAKEIGKLKADIAEAEKGDDKAKVTELNQQIDKLKAGYEPKKVEMLTKLSVEASKAGDDVKKIVGVALVNLKRAVEDAKVANGAAMKGYPRALPGITDDLQSTAKRVIADIIEEQVGKRPDLTNFKPDVSLSGGTPKLSIAGLPAEALASLQPTELAEKAVKRLVDYAKHTVILIGDVSETGDLLDFESDVLDAWLSGMKIDPKSYPDSGDDIAELSVSTNPTAKPEEAKERKIAFDRSAVSVQKAKCDGSAAPAPKAEPKEEPKVEEPKAEEPKEDPKAKKKDDKKKKGKK